MAGFFVCVDLMLCAYRITSLVLIVWFLVFLVLLLYYYDFGF